MIFNIFLCHREENYSNISADREIPTLGLTDKAGNSVNLVSGLVRLPSVGILHIYHI